MSDQYNFAPDGPEAFLERVFGRLYEYGPISSEVQGLVEYAPMIQQQHQANSDQMPGAPDPTAPAEHSGPSGN